MTCTRKHHLPLCSAFLVFCLCFIGFSFIDGAKRTYKDAIPPDLGLCSTENLSDHRSRMTSSDLGSKEDFSEHRSKEGLPEHLKKDRRVSDKILMQFCWAAAQLVCQSLPFQWNILVYSFVFNCWTTDRSLWHIFWQEHYCLHELEKTRVFASGTLKLIE